MSYTLSIICLLSVAVWSVHAGTIKNRNQRSSGQASSSASSNNGQGVMSVSTSNSGGGASSANSQIGTGPGSGSAVGSLQSSVSGPHTGTISSSSGPVVLGPGQSAGLGVSTGGGGVGSSGSPIDAGGIVGNGMQSPQQMLCMLRQNICEQCLRINQLQRVFARNSGTSATFTEMSCPGFCGTC